MIKYFYLILCSCSTLFALAQVPQYINYQGIARDVNGVPVAGQNINIDFLIYDQLTGGNVIYSETAGKNTDPVSGIFNHSIGSGSPTFGTFSAINWANGQKFLEIKINGTVIGRQQMMSVPYALYAETSGSSGSQSLQINGNNLSISGGNTINLPATSVTGSGVASVTAIGTNSFDVFVPQVNISGIGSTSVSGVFPNYSISSTGGPTSSINLSYMPGTGILSYSPAPFPGTLDINPALTFTNGILGVGSNTVNIPGTGLWTRPNATVTSLTNGADWVSIGNNNPLFRLDVTSVGNNFIASRAFGFGYTGFLIDRPDIAEAGYLIYRNAGSDMWTVGTHTNTSNYMIYNWAFSRPDISVNYSNGYVGMGTTTPSEKLDVIGNVEIPSANEYMYSSPKQKHLSVPVNALLSMRPQSYDLYMDTYVVGYDGESGYGYFNNGASGLDAIASAPVYLPDGATVTELWVRYYDSDASNNLIISLEKKGHSTINNSTMASATSSGNGSSPASPATQTITVISNPVIDNLNNAYYVKFKAKQLNSNLGILDIRIGYTVTKTD